MTPILQTRLPYAPWSDPAMRRLPGIQPLDPADWLIVDEAFAPQMARRGHLMAQHRDQVIQLAPEALGAAQELLEHVLSVLSQTTGYRVKGDTVVRPDGVSVSIGRSDPMVTLGQLVQEDLCILQKRGDQHVLTGAVLCFPASWTLAQKFMRQLVEIHAPVPGYSGDIAHRVQRLFDRMRVGRPLWRANVMLYQDAELFAPRRASNARNETAKTAKYLRSERQCLVKLPESGAVVFSIHTYVIDLKNIGASELARLRAFRAS
ncbi:MAG: DUF3445 domain-containing protein [Marinosulfonomonas sp.]|nr:DUF3445 domain-containing protein [Marinosulfonomonas sp.]